jgi:hypothetical protein
MLDGGFDGSARDHFFQGVIGFPSGRGIWPPV